MPNNALQKGAAGTGQWPPPAFTAATAVTAGEHRSVTVGIYTAYIKSKTARTTGASFDVTEASNWDYAGQNALGFTWPAIGTVFPDGFLMSIDGEIKEAYRHVAPSAYLAGGENANWLRRTDRTVQGPSSSTTIQPKQPVRYSVGGVEVVALATIYSQMPPVVDENNAAIFDLQSQARTPAWSASQWYPQGFKVTHASVIYEAKVVHAANGTLPNLNVGMWERLTSTSSQDSTSTVTFTSVLPAWNHFAILNAATPQAVTLPSATFADIGKRITLKNTGNATWSILPSGVEAIIGINQLAKNQSVELEVHATGVTHAVADREDSVIALAALGPWTANENVIQYTQRSAPFATPAVTVGLSSNSARTTGATLNAAELANWTYLTQNTVDPFPPNSLVPAGFKIVEDTGNGPITYESNANRTTGPVFNSTEQLQWTALSSAGSGTSAKILQWQPTTNVVAGEVRMYVSSAHGELTFTVRSKMDRMTRASFDVTEATFWDLVGQKTTSLNQIPGAVPFAVPVGYKLGDARGKLWQAQVALTQSSTTDFASPPWYPVLSGHQRSLTIVNQSVNGTAMVTREAEETHIIRFDQTTAGIALLTGYATAAGVAKSYRILHTGTASFTLHGFTITPGQGYTLTWNGTAWSILSEGSTVPLAYLNWYTGNSSLVPNSGHWNFTGTPTTLNNSTGVTLTNNGFTVTNAGRYYIHAQLKVDNFSPGNATLDIKVNGAIVSTTPLQQNPNQTTMMPAVETIVNLAAGDLVQITESSSGFTRNYCKLVMHQLPTGATGNSAVSTTRYVARGRVSSHTSTNGASPMPLILDSEVGPPSVASNTWTCPRSGTYFIQLSKVVSFSTASSDGHIGVSIKGTATGGFDQYLGFQAIRNGFSSYLGGAGGSTILNVSVGQTIQFFSFTGAVGTQTVTTDSRWSIAELGGQSFLG